MSDNSVTRTGDEANRDAELESVMADYIRACDAGQRPDRQQVLAQHPEIANDLREFFANRDRMEQLAQPFAPSVPPYEKSTLIRAEVEQIGACIGQYTLVQKLGEGGMGEVWVAKQSEPVKRKVALKLIKRGMDSKDVLARFEQERQALAMMDHPNIAKVFDGGVVGVARSRRERDAVPPATPPNDDEELGSRREPATLVGQPYFVMELVNGLPLTKYCDEAKLTPRQRMELFVPICQAVQHAHQKGIVHRDLKPSNILVTLYDGKPVPKVIDFGVAKAIGGKPTDESLSTQFGAVVGTLEYMSPEQAGFSGQDIDTRADIYSLGVILYELLTGLRPFDGQRLRKAALTELIRIIQEEEPSKPSTRLSSDASLPSLAALRQTEPKRLTALLRGELDWIVMKCLEKPRDRRYETANGLSRDIQRYLADEPVEARPPSARYRFHKFLLRHKGPVLAASLVLLVLISGIIGTTWGFMREAKQRKLAETNEGKANDAANKERIAKEDERVAKEKAVVAAVEERKQRDRADENAKLAMRRLYVADMNLAQAAWETVRVGRVRQLLEQHGPGTPTADLRGFEWFYWHRLCHRDLHTLKGQSGARWRVAFHPDGRLLASTGRPGTVKLWGAATGEETVALKGYSGDILNLGFSPDCAQVASVLNNKTVKLWDAATGQEVVTLKGHTDLVFGVAFSPDSKLIATWTGGPGKSSDVKLWDTATGEETVTLKGHAPHIWSVAFSPDGARIGAASNNDGNVKLWDVATGQESVTLKGRAMWSMSAAFSPDSTRIALDSPAGDNVVRIWDVATGQHSASLKWNASGVTRITRVAFSPSGKQIASGSVDGTVVLWDATTSQMTATLKGHTSEILDLAFSSDGARIASASGDQTVRLWDSVTGQNFATLKGHADQVWRIVFSPDGARIASVSNDDTVKVWDAVADMEAVALKATTGKVDGVGFSPDGKRVAAACRHEKVTIWDTATGHVAAVLRGHTNWVRSVAFNPNGKQIASVDDQATVKLWDALTGQEIRTLKGRCIAFSPDGPWIGCGNWDNTITLWNTVTGEENLTLKGHKGRVTSTAFRSDGTCIASASEDKTVKLWDAATGQEMLTFRGHTDAVTCVAFSSNGARIASASSDRTVKLWDAITGEATATLNGHTNKVNCVAFSPDGMRVASASNDQTVKLWDSATGQEILTMKDSDIVTSVAFSPDGASIASAGGWAAGGWVKLWIAPRGGIRE